MAKGTRHGGPSLTSDELADSELPPGYVKIRRAMLGEVDRPHKPEEMSWDGGSATQSFKSENPSNDRENHNPQQPAQMTESRSDPQELETTSGARSTVGNGQKTVQPRSPRKARVRTVELDDFEDFE